MAYLFFCLFLFLLACAGQAPKPAPLEKGLPAGITPLLEQWLPVDPLVETGKLENGLRYYIRRNQKPEERAELRLVVDAGSVLEREEQQGLAHFAEHMAFNGTEHFARQELVSYLESIGMRFGPDVNAYTSFDETVYMLQVPTDSLEIVQQGLQILADWAQGMLFAGEEIDKERGVVVEEWRSGRGAAARIRDQQLPIVLKGSRYAGRLPIGQKAVLDTFAHQALREFYRTWYRPDLMAVIAVGDFEVEWMKGQIHSYFSAMAKAEEKLERPLYPVPDHQETFFAMASDPEATHSTLTVYYKQEVSPQGTVGDYRRYLVQALYHRLMNRRLHERTIDADPPFLWGVSTWGRLVRTKEAYMLQAGVIDNGTARGLEGLLLEARRVLVHGFTQTELEREKVEMLRGIEQAYRERDKTPSGRFAEEYKRSFLTGEPIPGIEYEYGFYRSFAPEIGLEEVNELAAQWLRQDNRVIALSLPEKEGVAMPTEEELLAIFARVAQTEVEPYADEVGEEPLVEGVPEPAAIVERGEIEELGVSEWKLENGVRVLLKPTDFKNDEVLFSGSSPGGHSLAEDDEYIAARTADAVVREGGVGPFDQIALEKKLAGKVVHVEPWVDGLLEGFRGSASPQDLETLFQLVYLYCTAPRADTTAFAAYQARVRGMLQNRSASPEAAFGDTVQVTLAQHHFRARPWSEELVEEMDLEKSLRIYRERFGEAGDFTFFLVGNFALEQIEPLVRRYLGGLPSSGRRESWRDVRLEPPKGVVEKYVYRGLEEKSQTQIVFTGPFVWNYENFFTIHALAGVLRIKLREVLREDLGGTYGVGVGVSTEHYPNQEYSLSIGFGCAPERVEELSEVVFAQLDSLQRFGPGESYVQKVQEMQRRRHELRLRENSFWLDWLDMSAFHGLDPGLMLRYGEFVEGLSARAMQEAARQYFNQENYVRVVLLPEKYK